MFYEVNESVKDDRQTKAAALKPLLSVVGLYGHVPGFRTARDKAISRPACVD